MTPMLFVITFTVFPESCAAFIARATVDPATATTPVRRLNQIRRGSGYGQFQREILV